jgi:hypothetical protein
LVVVKVLERCFEPGSIEYVSVGGISLDRFLENRAKATI